MLWHKYLDWEKRLALFLKKRTFTLLRYSMGIIYFWYGLLKVIGISPVEELVLHTSHWFDGQNFVLFIGLWEMAIGLCLFIRKYNRVGLLLLFLQFPGTFLPLFLNLEDFFTIFPYGLTFMGQYIFKNLVLISVGLVLISSLHDKNQEKSLL